jgi:CSLREA domain-containing protein
MVGTRTRRGGRVASFALASLAIAVAARAATLTVSTTSDEYDIATPNAFCSLREAIQSVNDTADRGGCVAVGAYGTADRIDLAAQTYPVQISGSGEDANASGDFDLGALTARSVEIVGVGAGSTAIDGGDLDRVFDVLALATMRLADLSVRNGAADAGGGLVVTATASLTLERVTVEENTADAGAGIYVMDDGALTMLDSTVRANTATQGGGGLLVGGELRIENSTISGNSADSGEGGAMYVGGLDPDDPDRVITNTTISGNSAQFGGAMWLSGCFTGETPVWTETGARPIASIRPGDRVWARSETASAGEWAVVESAVPLLAERVRRLELGSGAVLRVTGRHPIWIAGRGWTEAADIQTGDRLVDRAGGELGVAAIADEAGRVMVYDLSVSGPHTYYVSDAAVLVHNK